MELERALEAWASVVSSWNVPRSGAENVAQGASPGSTKHETMQPRRGERLILSQFSSGKCLFRPFRAAILLAAHPGAYAPRATLLPPLRG
jgi:hypothetical protein